MCGICGQYNFGDSEPVARRDIETMTRTIVHRGPDDEVYHISGPLGLGFRRLSIIDVSAGPRAHGRRCGARSIRNEAALLQNRWRSLVFWFRDAPGSRYDDGRRRNRSDRVEPFLAVSLHTFALHHSQGHSETRSGNQANRTERILRVESMVQIQAESFCATKISRRSQGGVARALQARGEAPTH